jgi:hypothetical protein
MAANDSRTLDNERLGRELRRIGLNVGWIKTNVLKSRGRMDGKLGLPRPDKNGLWISPLIAKEQHAAETYMAQKWAELEISLFERQEEVQKLNLQIADIEAAISKKQQQAPAQLTEQELSLTLKQEEGAPQGVIRARRLGEWKKRTAGYFSSLGSLQASADSLKLQRAEHAAAIDESACVTRLLCEKKRDYHRQRVDIYYHGVLKTHPERKTMPPAPEFAWENLAENLYDHQHSLNNKEGKNEVF